MAAIKLAAASGALILGASGLAGCSAGQGAPSATQPTASASTASPASSPSPTGQLELPAETDRRYSGVGAFSGSLTCTAFAVDLGGPNDPAVALTAGHCVVEALDTTTVLRNVKAPENYKVEFAAFQGAKPIAIGVDRVLYGTMRGADAAVLRLKPTRAQLEAKGVRVYHVDAPPAAGQAVTIVGVPVVGDGPSDWYLRRVSCEAEGQSRLLEGRWLWDAANADTCRGIYPGSSGSPLFAGPATDTVVGIVNTTADEDAPNAPCTSNRPCQVAATGESYAAHRTYSMPIAALRACFPHGTFDATASGCPTEHGPAVAVEPSVDLQPGKPWKIEIADPPKKLPLLIKRGPLATTDCRTEAGYEPLTDGLLTVAAPQAEGWYLACVVARSASGQLELSAAGHSTLRVDGTPPPAARLNVVRGSGEATVDPIFDLPERASFLLKSGPEASTDCADKAGYREYQRNSLRLSLASGPVAVCVITFDVAGNQAEPSRQVIKP